MNRVKVVLFALLAAAAGVGLVAAATRAQVARAIAEADADLTAASAQLAFARRAQASDAAAIAGLAARDADLLQALSPGGAAEAAKGRRARSLDAADGADPAARQARIDGAAKAAIEAAAAALGIEIAAGARWTAATRNALGKSPPAGSAEGQSEAAAFLRDAAPGTPRRGLTRLNDGVFYGVATPAGEVGALALLLPLDLPWAKALRTATGVDVTLAAPGLPTPVSTMRPEEARAAESVARGRAPASAGTLSRAGAAATVLGVGPLPLLFASAPAARVLAAPLDGVPDGAVVLSSRLAPRVAPIMREQALAIGIIAVLLAVGLVVAALVRAEGSAPIPDELVSAAARIAAGDFGARAPTLVGRLGAVAEGLNRAAEAVQLAATPPPTAHAFGAAPAEPSLGGSGVIGGTFEAAPVARTATPWATLASAARAAPGEDADEDHWHQVFDEFLRTRKQCGEPSEGLTYDRFRVKLAKNKELLVQKYACRTVRFQVYVKQGKAALKATPVK